MIIETQDLNDFICVVRGKSFYYIDQEMARRICSKLNMEKLAVLPIMQYKELADRKYITDFLRRDFELVWNDQLKLAKLEDKVLFSVHELTMTFQVSRVTLKNSR